MAAPRDLVVRLRTLLDRLVEASAWPSEDQERQAVEEEVAAEARLLGGEGIVEALDRAVGWSRRRRREALVLLSMWTHLPEVVRRIGESLADRDWRVRDWACQIIARERLTQLAPRLNRIMERDRDPYCRDSAVRTAGRLRAPENLSTLLRLSEGAGGEDVSGLAWALTAYATEQCRPHLSRWFLDRKRNKPERVIAAWGLGKLGDKEALRYLVEMLDDPNETGETYSAPGESIRAAQALCDIYGWPFEWNTDQVARTAATIRRLEPAP